MEATTRAEAKRLGLPRFYTGKPCKNGHDCERFANNSNCVECARIERKAWRDRGIDTNATEYREKVNSAMRETRRRNPSKYLYIGLKAKSKREKIPFSLAEDDLQIPERCPVLGIPIAYGADRDHTPSVDKIIPALGYVPGNVKIISLRANRIKSDASAQELEAILQYVKSESKHGCI